MFNVTHLFKFQIFYISKFAHTETLFGPVGNLPSQWQNVVYTIEAWLYFVALGTLSAEFIYRYLVLNKFVFFPKYKF